MPDEHPTSTKLNVTRAAQESQAPEVDTRSIEANHDGKPSTSETDWKALALRLQADMDNFRKRQTRRANEAITAEQERLLRLTLSLADNLDRALSQDVQSDDPLHKGVKLTYRELMRLLEAEGVTRLETIGHAFDPNIHEAVASINNEESESNTVIEEIEAGYMLNGRLLRPARVVVAA